jgi:hypothetical protein
MAAIRGACPWQGRRKETESNAMNRKAGAAKSVQATKTQTKPMRKFLIAVAAAGLVASIAPSQAATLDTLGPGMGTLTIGGLTFSDFVWTPSPGAPVANLINVTTIDLTAWGGGMPTYGIQLQGPISVAGVNAIDMGLSYKVTATSAIIEDIYNSMVAGVQFGDGFAAVDEVVHSGGVAGPVVAQSSIAKSVLGGVLWNDPQDPPPEPLDVLVFPSEQTLTVEKNINLTGLMPGSLITMTILDQGFSVPEPTTYAGVFGLGLAGYTFFRRLRA